MAGVSPSGFTVAVAVAMIFSLSASIWFISGTKPEAAFSTFSSIVATVSVVSVAVSSVATASMVSAFSSVAGSS